MPVKQLSGFGPFARAQNNINMSYAMRRTRTRCSGANLCLREVPFRSAPKCGSSQIGKQERLHETSPQSNFRSAGTCASHGDRPMLLLNCVGAHCNPLTIDSTSSERRRPRPPHPRIRPSFRVLSLASARASACVFKTGSKVTRTYQPVQLACYLTVRAPSLCNHRCSRVRSFCSLAHILQVSGYMAKPISLRKHCCCLVALTSSSCGREQLCKDRLVSLLLDTFHPRIYRHCSPLDQSQDAEPAAAGCLESPGLPPAVARHAHGLHASVSCKVLLASARMLLLGLRMCIGPVRTD
jgi:hypothetical protein